MNRDTCGEALVLIPGGNSDWGVSLVLRGWNFVGITRPVPTLSRVMSSNVLSSSLISSS